MKTLYLPPKNQESPQSLIVLLHGFGASSQNLLPVAASLSNATPNTAFCLPDAPFPCEKRETKDSFQWFSLKTWMETGVFSQGQIYREIQCSVPLFNQWLDTLLERLNLNESSLVLAGFSQGGMMALHAGLRRKKTLKAIIGYSTFLPAPDKLKTEIQQKPESLLLHGMEDTVIPPHMMDQSQKTLETCAVPTKAIKIPDAAHEITLDAIKTTLAFLKNHIKI